MHSIFTFYVNLYFPLILIKQITLDNNTNVAGVMAFNIFNPTLSEL